MTSDAEVAVAAARAGAAVVRAAYGRPPTRHAKDGTDFATDTDLAAERAIRAVLADHRPDDAVLGEEFGGDASVARTWLVDPLCGTLNFAAQVPLFAVNVALQVEGAVVAAAVAEPLTGEVSWCGSEAAGLRHDGVDRPLRPSADSRLLNVNVDGPSGRWFLGPQLVADGEVRSRFGVRVASSTLALAWVASGRQAAYVTDGDLRDNVHFLAGLAVCRAAGAVVTDLTGAPLHTATGAIAAADPTVHAEVLAAVARAEAGRPTA